MTRSFSIGAMASLLLAAPPAEARQRKATFDDVMSVKAVAAPAISPDGEWVIYTAREWETVGTAEASASAKPAQPPTPPRPPRKDARTHLWRVSATDPRGAGAARQITFDEKGESAPAWSPDGKYISFLASRGGTAASLPAGPAEDAPKAQIWIMRAEAGEAWKVTSAKEGVTSYAWAPDSSRLAYVAREPLAAEEEARRQSRDDARVFEGDHRQAHLWMIGREDRKAVRLTGPEGEGARGDFTVRGEPVFSPDGARVAFVAAPTAMIRDERDDIYVVGTDGRALEKLTANLGPDRAPAWSPDGRTIAYVSETTGTPVGDGLPLQPIVQSHLVVYDVAAKRSTDVASADFDFAAGAPAWTPDGTRLLFSTGRRMYRAVCEYRVATRKYAALTTTRNVAGLTAASLSRNGRAAFVLDSAGAPGDVHVSDLTFAAPRKLTTMNPGVSELALGETEIVTWKSDALDIEGVLLKPVGDTPGKRYPLLVVVHGGPTGAFVNGFRLSAGDPGHHWAAEGWAVLYPNPRGSTNYGEQFMRANLRDWGGGDYRDIMAGVDAMVARGVADKDRLAVMGWSYGGYMTCWIVSQTTRFKAAMMGAGLSNIVSMYGTNDIPNYLASFFGGIPDRSTQALYLERSGIGYADRVQTPLLILHGGSDERVPIGQPMEFYRALKDRGRQVELVFYPREGHGLGEYYHQLDRLKRQFAWITTYTLSPPPKKTGTE